MKAERETVRENLPDEGMETQDPVMPDVFSMSRPIFACLTSTAKEF